MFLIHYVNLTFDFSTLSLPPRGLKILDKRPEPWSYHIGVGRDLAGPSVSPFCRGAAPAYQVTDDECFSLGAPATPPSVALLTESLGITLTFNGGKACSSGLQRSAHVTFECTRDSLILATQREEPGTCSHYFVVRGGGLGCPISCPLKDSKICGGNGTCVWVRGTGPSSVACSCDKAAVGPSCSGELALHSAPYRNSLLSPLLSFSTVFIVFFCCSMYILYRAYLKRLLDTLVYYLFAFSKVIYICRLFPVVFFCFLALYLSTRKFSRIRLRHISPLPSEASPPKACSSLSLIAIANGASLMEPVRAACGRTFNASLLDASGATDASLSVVIGAFQRPLTLKLIVDALRAQRLVQQVEIIVLDAGTSPPLSEQLPGLAVDQMHYWAEDGLYHRVRSFNKGVAAASHAFVVLLDDDVVPASDYWAHAVLSGFAESPQTSFLRLPLEILEFMDELRDAPSRYHELDQLRWGKTIDFTTTNFAVRKEAWDALGGFDWRLDGVYGEEDKDFHARAAQAGAVYGVSSEAGCALHVGWFFGNRGLKKQRRRYVDGKEIIDAP